MLSSWTYNEAAARQGRQRVLTTLLAKSSTNENLIRKFNDLLRFDEWRETPNSRRRLKLMLEKLVFTGLMAEPEVMKISGWHDVCKGTDAENWLSIEAMRDAIDDDQFIGDYLPVQDTIEFGQLIPIDEAIYIPRLRLCYSKRSLLRWLETFRNPEEVKKRNAWPDDGKRNQLSLVELFVLGADPFNANVWTPPLSYRLEHLAVAKEVVLNDVAKMMIAIKDPAIGPKNGIEWLRQFGTLPPDNGPMPQPAVQEANAPAVVDERENRNVRVLLGHDNWVLSAKFSPDGMRIVSASMDETIRIWNAETGAEIRVLRGHEKGVLSAAFSPDGMRIVSASKDATVRIWNAETGAEIRVLRGHQGRDVRTAEFSPDGTRIASGSIDQTIRIWNAETGAEIHVLRGHQHNVLSAVFSSDGTRIVSASADETIRIWNAETGAEIRVLRFRPRSVKSAVVSPDGTRIAASVDTKIRILNAATGAEIRVLQGHQFANIAIAFSPDGTRIVSASPDKTVVIWNAETGAKIHVLRTVREYWTAAFSPDGKRIVLSSEFQISIWTPGTLPNANAQGFVAQRQQHMMQPLPQPSSSSSSSMASAGECNLHGHLRLLRALHDNGRSSAGMRQTMAMLETALSRGRHAPGSPA